VERRKMGKEELEDAQKVNEMINGEGWLEVVKPALINRELNLIKDFSSATTFEQFVTIQQAINAIRNLLSFIEVTLAEGKKSFEEQE
jgi:hypothetical protein